MLHSEGSPKVDTLRSRSSTLYTQSSNTNSVNSTGSCGGSKGRKNLVMSTSFLSTKRMDNTPLSPTNPLQKLPKNKSANKALLSLKNDINQLSQELSAIRKKKENAERLRNSTASNIFTGTYSTSHLEKHTMRMKANSQIRELDNAIKKLEKNITESKLQYDTTLKSLESASATEHRSILGSMMGSSKEDLNDTSYEAEDDEELTDLDKRTTADLSPTVTLGKINRSSLQSTINTEETYSNDNTSVTSNMFGITDHQIGTDMETATWLVSDCMQSLQSANSSVDFILKKANDFVSLLKEHQDIRQELVLKSFLISLQNLLLLDDKLVVAAAYRICRYLIDKPEFVDELINLKLDAFIIISLTKENSFQVEREQALKLARAMMVYNKLPKSVLQSIISCVEKTDDALRNIALETLLEFCFINPSLVTECRGMRVLEMILIDYSSFSIASIILDTILQLMSRAKTRKHFLKDVNICILSTAFSDNNYKSSTSIENLQNSSILIARAMKTYDGCMLYSANNFTPLKELIAFFQAPLCAPYLIDIFLDVLRIKPMQYKVKVKSHLKFKMAVSKFQETCMPINQHIALLIVILQHSGFVPQLMKLINTDESEGKKKTLVLKARYLLSEYLNLAMNLVGERSFSFDEVVSNKHLRSIFKETYQLGSVTTAMNKNRNTLGLQAINYSSNVKKISQEIKAGALIRQVDDLKFRRMVYDSKVLQIKNFSLWNWNVIQELLEGPLRNPKQLEELGKTKFIRKLLVFYRPMRQRFSNVELKSRLAQKCILVGCKFFEMLTSNAEGMRILMDDNKIIPQLASLLFRAMERKMENSIFSEVTMSRKVVAGYFKFIGVLTRSSNGIKVLNKWNFFTVIYKMFQIESKMSLRFLLLTLPEIDLRFSPHCRIIMGKALVVSDPRVRLIATELIGTKLKIISEDFNVETSPVADNKSLTSNNYSWLKQFILEMLTRQLFDLNSKVVACADRLLYEFVLSKRDSSEELASWLRTSLNQMVFISSPILFELMSTKYGFQTLNELNYVEEERLSWVTHKDKKYVSIVEEFLQGFQKVTNLYSFDNSFDLFNNSDGRDEKTALENEEFVINKKLPLHFYESLAKTDEGISLITSSGDLIRFMNIIKKYVDDMKRGNETTEAESIIELKASMWSCGFIGSTVLGIGLLDNYSIVSDFITLSYESSETSIKFTAFFVLGLISKTKEGSEILDEMGWSCCVNVFDEPVGIALPVKIDSFISYNENPWKLVYDFDKNFVLFDVNSGDLVEVDKMPHIELDLDKLLTEKNKFENPLHEFRKIGAFENGFAENSTVSLSTKISNYSTKKKANEDTLGFINDTIESLPILINDEGVLDMAKVIEIIVESVCELSNHILTNAAIKKLTNLKETYINYKIFENSEVFNKVFDIITVYRFKPNVRKFLMGLFINKKSLKNCIKQSTETSLQ